jgi:predicted enzyme related to lactoylglutathione lyase
MTEARGSAGLNGTAYAPGTPCWVSLMVHGMAATQEFYGELFGWEFQPGPQHLGSYVRAQLDGQEVAGIGQLPPDRHLPIAWTPYFASDDVDLTAETVRHCGGTVGVGPLDARTPAGWRSPRTRRAPCSASGRPRPISARVSPASPAPPPGTS